MWQMLAGTQPWAGAPTPVAVALSVSRPRGPFDRVHGPSALGLQAGRARARARVCVCVRERVRAQCVHVVLCVVAPEIQHSHALFSCLLPAHPAPHSPARLLHSDVPAHTARIVAAACTAGLHILSTACMSSCRCPGTWPLSQTAARCVHPQPATLCTSQHTRNASCRCSSTASAPLCLPLNVALLCWRSSSQSAGHSHRQTGRQRHRW